MINHIFYAISIWSTIYIYGIIHCIGGDTVTVSKAQKKASAEYQRKNIASLACRVKKDEAEAFKEYCNSIGKTSNAVLREYVMQCIAQKP